MKSPKPPYQSAPAPQSEVRPNPVRVPLQSGPRHFINRELSWLEFNQRVLEEAMRPDNPLLERLKFYCIVSSNLDEFFEIRVAGLKQQVETGSTECGPDGLTPRQALVAIRRRVLRMVRDHNACWSEQLKPGLARHGIRFLGPKEWNEEDRAWLEHYYRSVVRPVLTPLAIDPAHPFPLLVNRALNLIVRLGVTRRDRRLPRLAVLEVPRVLPRLIRLPRSEARWDYAFLGEVIGHFLTDLFPERVVQGWWPFRVTRNSELYIDEEEVANLLAAVEQELQRRRRGAAVRLEVARHCPAEVRNELLQQLGLSAEDLYLVDGPLNPARLMSLYEEAPLPGLRYPSWVAPIARPFQNQTDLFAVIRQTDVLLHHPYESFESVVTLLQQAAADPDVLAIKQTLYRTGGDPRIVGALMEAVRNGKTVAAVVELRARFDEANNIRWARQLEEAGVHVVYGLVGYKIHCKATLIVRREGDTIRRYVHLGTGNYNPATARQYTDLGMLTCRPEIGEDVTDLFNLLTGMTQFRPLRQLWVAPFDLKSHLLRRIEREAQHAAAGLPARIIGKMNALVDQEVIEALYRASAAGVQIDLIVRGICCLRPGQRGVSESIHVRSIVDRFLEHSRIMYFENGGQPEVFLSSADWMPRNFHRRIEVAFPVLDGNLRDRVIHELLALPLADNVRARVLQADGTWRHARPAPGEPARRSQFEFMERAQVKEAVSLSPRNTSGKIPLRPRPVQD
ncbi:MAG: polyphosphate kinase 1 [Verrucomicrobiota bacterium]|nr:polyphosphate kinase 1 [Limisphaera sp.]MDW8380944.1 polyphosphate kinase 1 [Verrucomicrobiota bacterium]